MTEILSLFIFQASRRQLLARLLDTFAKASDHLKNRIDGEEETGDVERRRVDSLEKALRVADEQVRRLEYWSDVKEMAQDGETQGAVDPVQEWGPEWQGVDTSQPEKVGTPQEGPQPESVNSQKPGADHDDSQPEAANSRKTGTAHEGSQEETTGAQNIGMGSEDSRREAPNSQNKDIDHDGPQQEAHNPEQVSTKHNDPQREGALSRGPADRDQPKDAPHEAATSEKS